MANLPAPLGESPAFLAHLDQLSRVAPLERPVLIIGERGTGKELSAARVHFLSRRCTGPLVKLNCAALPESLLEAELFGVEPGAFTGAARRRIGRFELADGGTLFLDEIGNAGLAVQEKVLRVIEYGEFERLGGSDTLTVSVRVVAATNRDLPAEAMAGRFREDLLDRLAFDVLTLPPLRARTGDIALLADFFWPRHGQRSRVARVSGVRRRGAGGIRGLRVAWKRSRAQKCCRTRRSLLVRAEIGHRGSRLRSL